MKKLKIPFNAGATTEPAGGTSNLRAQNLSSFNAKSSTLSRTTRRCFRIYFVAGLRPIKTKKQHPFRFFFMKSARRVAVILWMTLLCRSNDRAGRRDFEPSSPGLGSFNAKNSTLLGCCFFALKKRETGIEPYVMIAEPPINKGFAAIFATIFLVACGCLCLFLIAYCIF